DLRFEEQSLVDPRLVKALASARRQSRRGGTCPNHLVDASSLVHELRRRKGEEEVALMERAAAITGEGHLAAMAHAQPGMYEYEIEALLRAEFRSRVSERVAYEPIVGSGDNATVLHYVKNHRQMLDGELLLIDA